MSAIRLDARTDGINSLTDWQSERSNLHAKLGASLVTENIVSGGRPSVTLSAGQDFKTSRCGSWLKQ
jgi:hypothetical protein